LRDTIRAMPPRGARRATRSACTTPPEKSATSGHWTMREALP
jgi:hypothetical protein